MNAFAKWWLKNMPGIFNPQGDSRAIPLVKGLEATMLLPVSAPSNLAGMLKTGSSVVGGTLNVKEKAKTIHKAKTGRVRRKASAKRRKSSPTTPHRKKTKHYNA
jgi:hypothetical protein